MKLREYGRVVSSELEMGFEMKVKRERLAYFFASCVQTT